MKYHRLDAPGDNGTVNSEVVWSANSTYSTILYANRAAKVCRQFGNRAGHTWGTKLYFLGHTWGTVGAQLGQKVTWGTLSLGQKQLGHSWGTLGAHLGHTWGTHGAKK